MAHKTLVSGTAYEISGGKTLINGTGYSIASGKTLVGGTGRTLSFVSYDPVFANNTWAQIIEACQTKKVPSTWVVGNQKAMTIGGTSYLIDIIGKNHDTYTAGGTAPLTFQLHDCLNSTYSMNSSRTNTTGWGSCSMRTSSMPSIIGNMPSEVQAGLKAVNKRTSAGGISSSISTTSDKLFLLSEIEIFGSVSYSFSGEGSRYAYYSSGGSAEKKASGSSVFWWERSPQNSTETQFCLVSRSGGVNAERADQSFYIAPAFCF